MQAAQQQAAIQSVDGHPPGLNGFQDPQHRQNLLGSLNAGAPQQPGLLNLGQTTRTLQSEADKRVSGHTRATLARLARGSDAPASFVV